jgi:hypothetical protein
MQKKISVTYVLDILERWSFKFGLEGKETIEKLLELLFGRPITTM